MKKIAITFDTNILIDFIDKNNIDNHVDFFKFINLFEQPNVDILLNDIVIKEWNELKIKRFKDNIKSLDDQYKSLEKFLSSEDVRLFYKDYKTGLEIINRYKNKYYAIAQRRLVDIDNKILFMKNIIKSDTNIVNQTLIKFIKTYKEPFFNKGLLKEKVKIEVEDALIFLSTYYYFKNIKGYYDEIYFVTNNKKDFSESSNPNILHEELKEYFEEAKIKYIFSLSNLYKEIDDSIIKIALENDEKTKVSTIQNMADSDFMTCPFCMGKYHEPTVDWINRFGFIIYICPECKEEIQSNKEIYEPFY